MKTMFSMGFDPNIFGSRVTNPALGRTPALGTPKHMGQLSLDGDALLKQLRGAESKAATVYDYVRTHPDLVGALGDDYVTFQNYLTVLEDSSSIEANVSEQLQATSPGAQYDITQSDYTALQNYIDAAETLFGIVVKHRPKIAPLGPSAKAAPLPASAPVRNDLVAPLLVGGGVLAIGVIALLARA